MMDKKSRDNMIRLLAKVQDAGQKWRRDDDGCLGVDTVRNANVVDFLIQNGVVFATDNNVCIKTDAITKQWIHESIRIGGEVLAYSRCPVCGGSVDGFVNYRHCPHCGEKMGK